jgi:hypothetical protein
MHSQIEAHFRFRGDLLVSGRIDELLDSYVFPLPIFLPSERLLLSGPQEARVLFALMREALIKDRIVALRPEVRAVELPRAGRFRVWVTWHEVPMQGGVPRSSSAIYFCRVTSLGPRVEMVNYTQVSMPELAQQYEALALSA